MSGKKEVAVIGCGVLGTSLCKQLLASPEFSDRTVVGVTKSNSRHESILEQVKDSEGRFRVATADDIQGKQFRDVVFCAPPSGFEDYPAAVNEAVTSVWDADAGGVFVFTSSGGIYGDAFDGGVVTEDTPVPDIIAANPRTAKLIKAEQACLQHGGCVLRLAGLYTLERGAHSYWFGSGKDVTGRSDGIINLLHYDDAASSCAAALRAGKSTVAGKICIVSDGNPTTRKGICESARKAPLYANAKIPNFLGTEEDSKGKVYDGSATNVLLKWKPTYSSFDEFMSSQE